MASPTRLGSAFDALESIGEVHEGSDACDTQLQDKTEKPVF